MARYRRWQFMIEEDPIEPAGAVCIHHIWGVLPDGSRDYHTAFYYPFDEMPGYSDGQELFWDLPIHAPVLWSGALQGKQLARTFQKMSRLATNKCCQCHGSFFDNWKTRWNIYRGEDHYHTNDLNPYSRHLIIPCFYQRWNDPAPPGYGPP